MKITAQEEYGLRILIRIAGCKDEQGMSIPRLSEGEKLTTHYVAKLARMLRMAGFINSTPGNKGGYMLAKPAREIIIRDVLAALGGIPFNENFTDLPASSVRLCTNSVDCSAKSLWQMIRFTVDQLLYRITLQDLVNRNEESEGFLNYILEQSTVSLKVNPENF